MTGPDDSSAETDADGAPRGVAGLRSPEPLPRPWLAVAAVTTIAVGLAARGRPGVVGDVAGGVLYTVLVGLLVLLVRPRTTAWLAGALAFVLSTLVELAQLTRAPAALAEAWTPLRFVLGSTFHAPDLTAYAAGAALLAAGVTVARRRVSRWAPGRTPG